MGYLKSQNNLSDLGNGSEAYQQLGGDHSAKLQGWFAALAARGSARANVVILGDSVTAGQGASSFAGCYAQLLAPELRSRFPTNGSAAGGRGFLPPVLPPTNPTTFTPAYVALTGATVAQLAAGSLYGYGPNLETWDISIQSGVTLTYSLVGDSADIMWVGATGNGTFSYQVDAGAVTNVSTSVPFTGAQTLTRVSLGTAGAHTLTIRYVSGTLVYITGVIEYNTDSASGIQVHDCGFSGSTTAFWTIGGGAAEMAAAVPALAPGLVIIELGLNDPASGITASAAAANVTTIISQVRAALTTPPPFLILADYNAAQDGPTTPAQWAAYVQAYYGVAAADPMVDILDLTLRMPSTGAANTWGLYNADGIHPNNHGHQMMADALAAYLSPA